MDGSREELSYWMEALLFNVWLCRNDLKTIYNAPSEQDGLEVLEEVSHMAGEITKGNGTMVR